MANNTHKYGFRFYASMSGSGRPPVIEGFVASTYQANVGTNTDDVGISIGDPVELLTDGSFALAEDTGDVDRLFGVVVGILNAKVDSNGKARPASYLPGGTTWTTKATESRIAVMPFGRDIWEIDVDENTTATTEADYRALIGLNMQMVYVPDLSNTDRPRANPLLDIGSGLTTTQHFRLFGISKTHLNQDLTGENVKVLVQLNQGSEPMFTATGL